MNIGFIGAGKVGFSLGRYFKENGISVLGYYSRNPRSAAEAAKFTNTKSYDTITEVVKDCDTIFVTTNDSAIKEIWNQIRNLNVKNKNICHCSGSITSTVFFDGEKLGAHIYSIHPLYAVSDKYNSWKDLSKAHFTIEGSDSFIDEILEIFKKTGNKTTVISTDCKTLYHCAAATASNLATAVFKTAIDMLAQCGFTKEDATLALLPLFTGNCKNIETVLTDKKPLEYALTGPIERNDVETIKKHLKVLSENKDLSDLYKILSQKLVILGKAKDSTKDYSNIEEVLQR